jgi:P27 family predicted phage terminase small subunit
MRGRKPKAAKLKLLSGRGEVNPGRINRHEPAPRPGFPECPAHLCAEARAEWGRIVEELHGIGLLFRCDRAALSAYCQSWAGWVEAEEMLAKRPKVIKAKGRESRSAWSHIAHEQKLDMHRYLSEFGLSPASRTRIKAEPKKAKSDFESLLES